MAVYMFRTIATMKEYNRRKWSIDPDIIRTKYITADSLREALQAYAEEVNERDYIAISANAMHHPAPMYIDTKEGTPRQVGYVITGKTEMQRDNGTWSTQYIDLWISVDIITSADFEQEAI